MTKGLQSTWERGGEEAIRKVAVLTVVKAAHNESKTTFILTGEYNCYAVIMNIVLLL